MVSLSHPHDPYVAARKYWDLYNDDDIDLPQMSYEEAPKDAHSERQRRLMGIDRVDWTEERTRTIRRAYYANISYVDEKFREILDALEDSGFAENTIIIFTSDHGDMLGERGLYQKRTFFENAIRVPMFVTAPALYGGPRRVAEPVSLVDLLPTLFDMAGGQAEDYPEQLEGDSLVPCLNGDSISADRPIYAEMLSETTNAPLFMIRKNQWKLIWSMTDPPMLFDLENDPQEQCNLAGDDRVANVQSELEAAVHTRWDVERVNAEVLADQSRRLFILKALDGKEVAEWDAPPPASGRFGYFRGEPGYGDWADRGTFGLQSASTNRRPEDFDVST